MVENVEKFETDIKSIVLVEHGALENAEVGVVEARAVEETTVGCAEGAEVRIDREGGR